MTFRFTPSITEVAAHWPEVPAEVVGWLAERDRQLEDYLSALAAVEMFSHAGTPTAADESGPWFPRVGGQRLRVTVGALTAGSTSTVITVYVSGVSAGTVTLAASDGVHVSTLVAEVRGSVDGTGDAITVAATTVGTGVEDVTVEVQVLT